MRKTIITVTGPSCAGKSTLEALLVKKGIARIISATSRPIRSGEVNGREYHFLDKSKMSRLLIQGAFVESVEFNGNHYGVLQNDVHAALEKSGAAVVVVEPHGRVQFEDFAKYNDFDIFRVFVNNPQEVILKRFLMRFGDEYITKFDAAAETYASRLQAMLTTEKEWSTDEALKSYDLVINAFDETTVIPSLQSIARVLSTSQENLAAA